MNESTHVILQRLLSWFSMAQFKLEKLVDWLRVETDDLGDDRKMHTSPGNATVHTVKGHTCCFIYFRCFNLLILTLCLKPNGFECQVLAHDPKCVFYHPSAWRCRVRVSVKIYASCCSISSPLQALLLCLFSLHSLFSLGPQTRTHICTSVPFTHCVTLAS